MDGNTVAYAFLCLQQVRTDAVSMLRWDGAYLYHKPTFSMDGSSCHACRVATVSMPFAAKFSSCGHPRRNAAVLVAVIAERKTLAAGAGTALWRARWLYAGGTTCRGRTRAANSSGRDCVSPLAAIFAPAFLPSSTFSLVDGRVRLALSLALISPEGEQAYLWRPWRLRCHLFLAALQRLCALRCRCCLALRCFVLPFSVTVEAHC